MIYLLGVDHRVQHNRDLSLTKSFVEYLETVAKELNILLLAEEFSAESVFSNNVPTSTVQDVAKKLDIEHKFCDLDTKERRKIGYPLNNDRSCHVTKKIRDKIFNQMLLKGKNPKRINFSIVGTEEQEYYKRILKRKYRPTREKFWFFKIKKDLSSGKETVFICGFKHLKTFRLLLVQKGFEVVILPWRFDLGKPHIFSLKF
jgi:hypothetical protein